MCTVVYISQSDKKILTSLRDETPNRHTITNPANFVAENTTYVSPIDPQGGGTWLGINNKGNAIILLNGGFEKHEQKVKYRKSRGLIVKELLENEFPLIEWMLMDLSEIEPFSLIVFSDAVLFQLVWDGNIKHKFRLNEHSCYIFSSSTLYSQNAKTDREYMFKNWVDNNKTITENSIMEFFKSSNDSENGFIINRHEKVKTLSFTYIEINDKGLHLNYHDLLTNTISHNYISCAMCPD